MRSIVFALLVLVYILAGMYFHLRAMNGRIDPQRPPWSIDLVRPHLFTPEGQQLRRAALIFYAIGGLVLIVAFWTLAA
jgi:hypothetical protein